MAESSSVVRRERLTVPTLIYETAIMLQDYSIPPAAADTPSKTINKPPPPIALTAPILFRKIRKHPKKFVLNANLSFSLLPLVLPHTYNTNRENHCKLENCTKKTEPAKLCRKPERNALLPTYQTEVLTSLVPTVECC